MNRIHTNMILIAAVDRKNAIGKNGGLIYRVPEDMKHFKERTTGNIVVMGRKTLESFPNGKPLPNRLNIVLSGGYENTAGYENLRVARGTDELQAILQEENDGRTVYIIGGESVYRAFCDACDGAILTEIDAETADADAFFPVLEKKDGWMVTETSEWFTSSSGLNYRFVTYHK